jgi:hypothetical protein
MFTEKELEANAEFIKRRKEDILNSKGGSDLDYIRDLQTLIALENAVEKKRRGV